MARTRQGPSLLERVEGNEDAINEEDNDEVTEFDYLLFSLLIKSTSGEPRVYVDNAGPGQGLKAWRELDRRYDPRGKEDRPTALEKVMDPFKGKRPSSANDAPKYLQ